MHKIIIYLTILICFQLRAQFTTGIVNSTRSGISGARMNPSFIADSRNWLDITLFTLDIFEENTFLYIPSEHYYFTKLFQQKPNWRDYDGKPFKDYFENGNNLEMHTQVFLQFLSGMIQINRHGFGLQNNIRQHANIQGVANHTAKFLVEGISYRPLQDTLLTNDKLSFRHASWYELGLTYAYLLLNQTRSQLSFGITVKKLFGLNGFFVDARNLEYIVYDDSTLHVRNVDINYGYSPSAQSGNEFFYLGGSLFNGSGWGFDLGVMFQLKTEGSNLKDWKPLCVQKYDNYKFKLGFSLLDIGWLKFKRNITYRQSEQTEIYWQGINKYEFSGIGNFTQDLAFHAWPPPADAGKEFNIWLPSAFSSQLDVRIYPQWYVNTTFVHGLPFANIRLTSPSYVAITPRYETYPLEVNVPFILYNWQDFRPGLAIRFFWFILGTDNLNTIFGYQNFTGFDVYAGIKIQLTKGVCTDGFSDFFRGKRFYQIACPD